MLIHPTTQSELANLKSSLPHAVVIHGPHGVGKQEAIYNLIKSRHSDDGPAINVRNWQYVQLIEPIDDKKSIGIAQVKSVEELISLKESHSRYIVVNQAELLTTEAQNAFLKTLEEPPPNVHIILLTDSIESLLPTIRSRSRLVHFLSPDEQAFVSYFVQKGASPEMAKKLYYITNAHLHEAQELLDDPALMDNKSELIDTAKRFMQGDLASRVDITQSILSTEEKRTEFIQMLLHISASAHRVSTSRESADILGWGQRIEYILKAYNRLEKHVQPRLVFAELMLEL